MDQTDQVLHIYISEILLQKDFALESYDNFLDALSTQKFPKKCLYHIHHFLVHTSNIIKILFPAKNLKNQDNTFIQERAEKLRKEFRLSESDFDIHEIGVRNDFEHYDTRIDFWVQNSSNHNYCDMNIMPPEAISGLDVKDMFRNLDPERKILSFCGKEYNLDYMKNFLEEKIKQPKTSVFHSHEEVWLKALKADLDAAEQQVKKGEVYSQEEIMKEFGLL